MANWADTSYTIEGNPESLRKIHEAILHHSVREGSSDSWEGNVINQLGLNPDDTPQRYLRGFIEEPVEFTGDLLKFNAEEAWGVTDFDEFLTDIFPDIKVWWSTEEPMLEVYQTNDKEGKFYPERYIIDLCINEKDDMEYFQTKEQALQWLSSRYGYSTEEQIEAFNNAHEKTDNYINLHSIEVV